MLYTAQEILVLADKFEKIAKDKPKLDPKAKVRNRGTVCVPASQAKDHKDHFPINNINQARNALARVHQYSKVPPWYKGSLKGLQDLVSRKVHSKYPSIGKSEKSSKKSSLDAALLAVAQEIEKLGQSADGEGGYTADPGKQINKNLTGQQILKQYPNVDLADLDDWLSYGKITEDQYNQLRYLVGGVDRPLPGDDPQPDPAPQPGDHDYEIDLGPRPGIYHLGNPPSGGGAAAPQGSGGGGRGGGYPSIPKDVQNSLNFILGTKLKVDGKLGPQTRAALDQFKATYKMPAGTSDKDLIAAIRQSATNLQSMQGAASFNAILTQAQQFINKAWQDVAIARSSGKGMDPNTLREYQKTTNDMLAKVQGLSGLQLDPQTKETVQTIIRNLQVLAPQFDSAVNILNIVQPQSVRTSRLMDKLIQKYGQQNDPNFVGPQWSPPPPNLPPPPAPSLQQFEGYVGTDPEQAPGTNLHNQLQQLGQELARIKQQATKANPALANQLLAKVTNSLNALKASH